MGVNGVTMQVDDSRLYQIPSSKVVNMASPIFVGGIPGNMWSAARSAWHIRNTTSFVGKYFCVAL